jgi:hypothetical protein
MWQGRSQICLAGARSKPAVRLAFLPTAIACRRRRVDQGFRMTPPVARRSACEDSVRLTTLTVAQITTPTGRQFEETEARCAAGVVVDGGTMECESLRSHHDGGL